MKVAFVRGSYLNMFEGQNYELLQRDISVLGIGSIRTLHSSFPFPVVRLPSLADVAFPRWIANRTLGDRQNLWGLHRVVRDADIVHTADPHYYYSYQLAIMRRKGLIRNLIATSWETIPFNNESTTAKRRIKQFTMQYIDHYLCHTRRAKTALTQEGVPARNITVLPLGVDLTRFSSKSTGTPGKTLRILSAGRNVPEKGINDYQLLQRRVPTATFRRVSDVPYQEMPRRYQDADIFLHLARSTPTWEEQYGMVLVEAMASGLPIIAYRTGAVEEVVGDAGILVAEGNIDELNRSIRSLETNRKRYEDLRRTARRRVEQRFDREKFARSLLRLYQKNRYTS